MRKKQVGSYIVTDEADHIKVSHENGSFNFRVKADASTCNNFFRDLRSDDVAEALSVVFAAIQLSSIRSLQDVEFARRLISIVNEGVNVELTKEEDDKILNEEKALYEMGTSSECTE